MISKLRFVYNSIKENCQIYYIKINLKFEINLQLASLINLVEWTTPISASVTVTPADRMSRNGHGRRNMMRLPQLLVYQS